MCSCTLFPNSVLLIPLQDFILHTPAHTGRVCEGGPTGPEKEASGCGRPRITVQVCMVLYAPVCRGEGRGSQ